MVQLKKLRNKMELSQAAVAEKLGITQQAYANYERGARHPDLEMLIKLSALFNVSVDFIVGKTDISNSNAELQGIDTVLYDEIKDLTNDEKQDVLFYVRFKKAQKNK